MARKKTHEEYVKDVHRINPDIEVIDKYIGNKIKIKHRCKIDDVIWSSAPDSILSGKGCPLCKKRKLHNLKAKTHNEYVNEVKTVNPDIEVIGTYINNNTKILHRCKIHNVEWYTIPSRILQGQGCLQCKLEKIRNSKLKDHNQYVSDLSKIHPTIQIMDVYEGNNIKILHKCNVCGSAWMVRPGNLLNGQGCPVCSGSSIGPSPEYKNSIWASEYRDYFSKYLTEKQMKMYTPHSKKSITITCKDCGSNIQTTISLLFRYGMSCMCKDGQSYPNKFVYNVLHQLNLNVKPEYSPQWANGKRYDDYLIDYNIVIENHGKQHYTEQTSLTHRSLDAEKANDKEKRDLAIKNGVSEYIVIDCSQSSLAWIRHSIMSSQLPSLLKFTDTDINWDEADKYATKSLIKDAAELFNQKEKPSNIARKLSVTPTTIIRWLRKATELGWCDYVSKSCIN